MFKPPSLVFSYNGLSWDSWPGSALCLRISWGQRLPTVTMPPSLFGREGYGAVTSVYDWLLWTRERGLLLSDPLVCGHSDYGQCFWLPSRRVIRYNARHPVTAEFRISNKCEMCFWQEYVPDNSELLGEGTHRICAVCSVTKSCPTFCDRMDCSSPGFSQKLLFT